jgi:hypothetical protein
MQSRAPELAALLKTNGNLLKVNAALAVVVLALVVLSLYLAYGARRMRYTTVGSGVNLSLPGEIDALTVGDFAEGVIARLGNVTPETIQSVGDWVMARAQPQVRIQFESWLSQERTRIQAEDIVLQAADPQMVAIEKVNRLGTPLYQVRVRVQQTMWIASEPVGPRWIDVGLRVTVDQTASGPTDLVIAHFNFPDLYTLNGEVVDVTAKERS